MNKFAIFAGARTGSTSLAKVLSESPDVKMEIEPFHEGFSKWNPKEKNYSELIKDPQTMNSALDELFSKYTAIKVLTYQFPEEIYYTMLGRKDLKILFLRRKYVAQEALSGLIAEQTSQYHKQDNQEIYKYLKPIDLDNMQKMIDYITDMNSKYESFLEKNRKGEYLPLYYEDLYSEDLEQNTKNLQKICDFLGISLPPKEAIKKHMLPSEAKINYTNIYKNVPNFKEIEKRFGGRIFMAKPIPRAVGIVINDSKVLLMWRKKDGHEYYVFPGGGKEENETIEEAVVRETKEEASMEVKIEKLLYTHNLIDSGNQYFYLCSYISGEPELGDANEKQGQNENDQYKPMWVEINKLPNLLVYPLEIRDWLIEDFKTNFQNTPREQTFKVSELRQKL